jgi:hypothetical protein
MNRPLVVAMLLGVAALGACDKNAVQDLPLAPIAAARIKFFNFGVNNTPGVNFYANETKMTAISSGTQTEATTGVTYGNVGNGGIYSAIAPGTYTLTGRIAATTNKNLPIDALSTTIADGKFYSFYLSGAYDTTANQVDAFILEDPVPAQWDYSVAYVRFVHAIYNANPMTLYVKNTDTTVTKDSIAIGGAVAYKAAGAFTAVPNGVYGLITRYTGANTSVISRSNVSFVRGHLYTVGARGDITKTTGTFAPALDNTANR